MYKIISKKDYMVSEWSGGKTTQVYIYPDDASYIKRNFLFRLSSATVETETSTFTKLDGIHRILMILKGEAFLKHQDHHEVHLKPYEMDEFEGEWNTVSCGKVEDFNVMLKGCTGMVTTIELSKGFRYDSSIGPQGYVCWKFYYSIEGNLNYTINEEHGVLEKGDLLVADNKSQEDLKVSIFNEGDSKSIKCIQISVIEK